MYSEFWGEYMSKKIPPVIVIALTVIYVIFVGCIIAFAGGFTLISLFAIIITSLIVGALIATLVNRMKEIDEEDKDDLKKY